MQLTNLVIENYLIKSKEKLRLNLTYESFDEEKTKSSTIWIIFLKDTRSFNFEIPEKFSNFVEIEKYELNRTSLHLLEKLK